MSPLKIGVSVIKVIYSYLIVYINNSHQYHLVSCHIVSQLPDALMDDLWTKLSIKYGRFDAVKEAVELILSGGYPLAIILSQLHNDVVVHKTLSDVDKSLICEKIAQVCTQFIYLFLCNLSTYQTPQYVYLVDGLNSKHLYYL